MERTSINITFRKDGRYMGKFIVDYDDNGKAQYQYVYGKSYDEAERKVQIGQEVASRYLSGSYADKIDYSHNRSHHTLFYYTISRLLSIACKPWLACHGFIRL